MFSKKIIISIILLALFAALASWPLFQSGFFVTDDGDWMIIRLSAFHATLKSGQFPVRYLESLNHGYGYPVLNFLYPLPFYAGEGIHLMGQNFEGSVKAIFILSFFMSGLAMFLYAKSRWGVRAGFCAAVVYIFLPYRLFDVYTRGSLGEAVAFVFIPLVFHFLDKFVSSNRKIDLTLGALSYSGLILSHNIVAFITSIGLTGYIVYKSRYRGILMIVFGLVISAFFWLPAIHDIQYTRMSSISVSDYKNYFLNLTSVFQNLGPGGTVLCLLGLMWIMRTKDKALAMLLFGFGLILFLSSSISDIVWSLTPLPKLVQFPWRFLALGAFLLSAVMGYLGSKINRPAVFVIVILVVIWGLAGINPVRTFHPDSYYSTNDDSTTVRNEYMPRWLKNNPVVPAQNYLEVLDGQADLISENRLEVSTQSVVRINKVFFPGMAVKVNGVSRPFEYVSDGLLRINLQPGSYIIKTSFEETPLRLLADFVSLIGIIVSAVIIIKCLRK